MSRQWTVFTPTIGRVGRDRMHITVNARGVFLLNGKAFEALGSPEAAVLLYDERYSVIGVRPAPAHHENAIPFAKKGKNAHRLIYASAFFHRFGLKVPNTQAFYAPEIDGEGILELDLNKVADVTSRRTKEK